jgi:hypothetical protein
MYLNNIKDEFSIKIDPKEIRSSGSEEGGKWPPFTN